MVRVVQQDVAPSHLIEDHRRVTAREVSESAVSDRCMGRVVEVGLPIGPKLHQIYNPKGMVTDIDIDIFQLELRGEGRIEPTER